MLDNVTIIIVTWNNDPLLDQCLSSLAKIYSNPPPIFVVDNASLESTKILCKKFSTVKYLPSPHNLGFAGGNNLALPYCKTDYLLLLNNDTQFLSDSITPIYEFIRDHPKIGAVQGRALLGSDKTKLDGCGLQLTPRGSLVFPGYLRPYNDHEFTLPHRLFAAGGAFLMLRRSAIMAIGDILFYDFFFAYYEDVDLGTRLGLCGYESWYFPTPAIIHHKSISAKNYGAERIRKHLYRNQWSSVLICFKLYGILRLGTCLILINLLLPLMQANFKEIIFQIRVVASVIKLLPSILSARKRFQPFRNQSDLNYLKTITHLSKSG